MVILITGAHRTGKTVLAQRMLKKLRFPYLCIVHMKMGLIRSGNTTLMPEDGNGQTAYLRPIVREIVKTAIENRQDLIVEGCCVPYDWRQEPDEAALAKNRFLCFAMTDTYIVGHFDQIQGNASDLKRRLDDSCCTMDRLKAGIAGFRKAGEAVVLIDENYERCVDALLDVFPA